LITCDRDGMEQIAEVLRGESNVDAIHIISHGRADELFIGSSAVDTASLTAEYADELAIIRAALSEDADVLVYGCSVANGDIGQNFIDALAVGSDGDVAASTNDTGSEAKGGDWNLEASVGSVTTQSIQARSGDGLLAPITITPVTGTATAAGNTLATNILGNGITLNSATFADDNSQAGTFTSATGYTPEWLGYGSGILLSTGTTRANYVTAWVAVTTNQTVTAANITVGNLRFVPVAQQNGSPYTTIGVQVSDGSLFSATQTLTVNVTPVNDAPTSISLANRSNVDGASVSVNVSSSFSDIDAGDTLTFSATGLPTGLSINPTTGLISGTISNSASVSGPYSVTITATDSGSATTSQSFTWTVTNPAPTVVADTGATTENSSIFFSTELSVNEVFRCSAYRMIDHLHEGNESPSGFNRYALACELAMASLNAGEG
jgi:hypothetical protein